MQNNLTTVRLFCMEDITFLAVTNEGVGRAYHTAGGGWKVETLLGDQDIRCLAADPLDRHIVYAGSQGSGVFRSADGGCTWQPFGLQGQIVKSLAVSPHRQGLVYAGVKPAQIWRRDAAGDRWTELEGFRRIPGRWLWWSPAERPYYQAYVMAIALSPADPDILLAGMEFGAVVRSEDGGRTWSGHLRGALRDCHNLKFHARDGGWIYESGGTGGGASFSDDSGRTWRKKNDGLAKGYGVSCAADPRQPDIWYVAVAPGPGKAYGAEAEAYLYRASGGAPWQPVGWESHPMRQMPTALVTDPGAPGHLYAGTTGGQIWHSADYGDQWQSLPFRFTSIWFHLLII